MQISLHRVWLLARKQWAENRQLYSLGSLALAGIISAIIIFFISIPGGFTDNGRMILLMMGLCVCGSLFTVTILSQFSDKVKSISALMLPASVTEKLIVAFFYSFIAFPLVYFIITIPILYIGHYVDTVIVGHINQFQQITLKGIFGLTFAYMALQSFFLLSSVLFKRYVIIKSVLLLLLIIFGMQAINPVIANVMIKQKEAESISANVKIVLWDLQQNTSVDHGSEKQVFNPRLLPAKPFSNIETVSNLGGDIKFYNGNQYNGSISVYVANPYEWAFVVLLIMAFPFLWVITWFRVKEKQL